MPVNFSGVYSAKGAKEDTPMPYGLLLVAGLIACVLSISAMNDDAADEPLVRDTKILLPNGR